MVGLSSLIGLMITEIGLRMFLPQQESMEWFLSNEKYGYVNKANFHQKYHYVQSDFIMDVKTNSFGHRAADYNLSRLDIRRILLLGDSFTFGQGVNIKESFSIKLEILLNQLCEKFVVINTGVGGWGTLQENTYAKDHFDLFKPDIIVITFCGNDPDDDVKFKNGMSDNEKGVIPFPGKTFFRRHSHLYRMIFYKYYKLVHTWYAKWMVAIDGKPGTIDMQSGSIITEDGWKETLGYIRTFHHEFLKFNANGILLVQATSPLEPNIRNHLLSISNGKNLIYVDLFDDVNSLKPEQRRTPHDGHWGPKMHSISAEKIFNAILKYK